MEITNRKIDGVKLVKFNTFNDIRGCFNRVYDIREFELKGLPTNWVQENYSISKYRGTMRGIHLQLDDWAEAKLIQCLTGSVFDVFVDLRSDSPFFGDYGTYTLNSKKHEALFLPRGVGHASITLEENSMIYYKVDNFYNPKKEASIFWKDKDIGIDWDLCDIKNIIVSDRDRKGISLLEFEKLVDVRHCPKCGKRMEYIAFQRRFLCNGCGYGYFKENEEK